MYTIAKQFQISASHQLDHLPDGHKCSRLHGHNYVVEVELAAETLSDSGFVVDYGDLAVFKGFLDDELDHRHLNDVVPCLTTAEAIARFLYDAAVQRWPQTSAVRVRETAATWAEYRP